MPRTLLLLTVLIFFSWNSKATITTAVTDGDWTSGATWDNGAPGCFDTVMIPASILVQVSSNINLNACGPIAVIISGELHFLQGSKLQLPCNSYVQINPGGSVTANNYNNNGKKIEICGSTAWQGQDGMLTGPTSLGNNPLPIELLYFNAVLNKTDRTVELNWSTASESNNDFFTIERSSNGTDWLEIKEDDGAGNSIEQINYADVDERPLFGPSFYRLKQTNFDGTSVYSPVVEVYQSGGADVVVYPNPVLSGNDLQLDFNQLVITFPDIEDKAFSLQIVSIDGKVMYTNTINLTLTKQLFIPIGPEYSAGMYLVNTQYENTRFVVQ